MPKKLSCAACGKEPLTKDEKGASNKFLGPGKVYCLSCLAEITGFDMDELKERIEQLKDDGCKYFS